MAKKLTQKKKLKNNEKSFTKAIQFLGLFSKIEQCYAETVLQWKKLRYGQVGGRNNGTKNWISIMDGPNKKFDTTYFLNTQ